MRKKFDTLREITCSVPLIVLVLYTPLGYYINYLPVANSVDQDMNRTEKRRWHLYLDMADKIYCLQDHLLRYKYIYRGMFTFFSSFSINSGRSVEYSGKVSLINAKYLDRCEGSISNICIKLKKQICPEQEV